MPDVEPRIMVVMEMTMQSIAIEMMKMLCFATVEWIGEGEWPLVVDERDASW